MSMAYDLHIERSADKPITLDEWLAAITSRPGVRPFTAEAHTITNPKTGEVISLGARRGDAEVYFPHDGRWYPAFSWRRDSAVFSARFNLTETSHPTWKSATALAATLGAMMGKFMIQKLARPLAANLKNAHLWQFPPFPAC
jgi:hypothetical protein